MLKNLIKIIYLHQMEKNFLQNWIKWIQSKIQNARLKINNPLWKKRKGKERSIINHSDTRKIYTNIRHQFIMYKYNINIKIFVSFMIK